MANSVFPTPFKLTAEELLISSAATIIFKALSDSGRENVSISQICDHPQYGYTASAQTIANGPRFVRITDIKGGSVNWDTVPYCTCDEPENYIIKPNDILVARAGSIGKSFLVSDVPEVAVFASYMIRLRAREGTLPNYIYWFFQSQQFWLQIASFDRGSAMSNINGTMLSAINLPRASQNEQKAISDFLQTFRKKLFGEMVELPELLSPMQNIRRIVARIEALAALVAEAQSLRREAREEAEVLVHRATSQALDEMNWNCQRLETVLAESPRNGLGPQEEVEANGKKMLRISAVSSSPTRYVDLSTYKLVDVDEELARPFFIQHDDVFIVRYNGDINRVAKSAIYKATDDRKIIYPDKLMRLRTNHKLMLPDFLVYALSSHRVRAQIEEIGKTTAGQIGVSGANAKAFIIPVPPVEEQRRLVAYLDGLQAQVSALRARQAETGKALSALMPSILDRAFKGEL